MVNLLRLDAIHLLRDRLAVLVLALGAAACLLAGVTGHVALKRLESTAAESARGATIALDTARAAWVEAPSKPPEEAVLVPSRVVLPVALAAPVLPDFTLGRSAFEPTAANVRLASRPDNLFSRYQVENPERLARGSFDLSFVAVVLAPLLLIGLGHGVFVSDRDAGTARLWLAQAGSPLALIAVRSVNRLALVAVPLAVTAGVLVALGPDTPGRGQAAGLWVGVAMLSLLFWWAVILLVNTLRLTAETAAFLLLAIWTLLIVVAPVAISTTAALRDPPPSRFEAIAASRSAEIAASKDFDDDHPDLASSTLEGRRASVEKGVEVRRAMAAAIQPLQETYDRRIAAQQATSRALSVVSPPLLTSDTLASIAGTDLAFYSVQRQAAVSYLQDLGVALTAIARGQRPVDSAAFDSLPRFAPPPGPRPSLGVAVLLLLFTAALTLAAAVRLRRVRPF